MYHQYCIVDALNLTKDEKITKFEIACVKKLSKFACFVMILYLMSYGIHFKSLTSGTVALLLLDILD